MQDQRVNIWHKSSMAKRIPLTPEMAEKATLIGKRIRLRREQKQYTQLALAIKVGLTSGAIGQYETGRNLPMLGTLAKLAKELDVTTEWLMTGDEPDETIKAHTTAERDALRLIRAISPEKQAAALAMLRGLADEKKKED